MGDDGSRDKVIASLYFDLATAYKDNNINGIIILKARVEREERHKINEESHPLYSDKKGRVLSFPDKVMELNELYDDLMFDLADNSNESMKDVKNFNTEEVIKFNTRVIAKIKRKTRTKEISDA